MEELEAYKSDIRRLILLHEKSIKKVFNIEFIDNCLFTKENLNIVDDILKAKAFNKLKNIIYQKPENVFEYLNVVKFTDEENNEYYATIYDNEDMDRLSSLIQIYRV